MRTSLSFLFSNAAATEISIVLVVMVSTIGKQSLCAYLEHYRASNFSSSLAARNQRLINHRTLKICTLLVHLCNLRK